ncbi:hypothetical protein GS880_07510 [Rhodococcus hoagii]|nr:hypothetical protein [Prescottella equi]
MVTAPAGFRAAGIKAGIKVSGRSDLALVVNEGPDLAAAGVFTRQQGQGRTPSSGRSRCSRPDVCGAVVLNSGGRQRVQPGRRASRTRTRPPNTWPRSRSDWGTETGAIEVAVCSTGLIGDRLPMDKVLSPASPRSCTSWPRHLRRHRRRTRDHDARTPSRSRRRCTTPTSGTRRYAKGAGMLAPSLATMLCVVTTDAVAPAQQLDEALRHATRMTFESTRRRRRTLPRPPTHRPACCRRAPARSRRRRRAQCRGSRRVRRPWRSR